MTGGLVAVHCRGPRPRRDLGRAQAARGLRHQRRAHPALVRPAERPERARCRWAPRSTLDETPRFRVRAVGAFKQKPGCPELRRVKALAPERLERLCRGECYNPSDERQLHHAHRGGAHPPAGAPGEPVGAADRGSVAALRLPARPGRLRRRVRRPRLRRRRARRRLLRARHPGADAGRQRRRPALRATTTTGNCVEVHPCYGDYRTPYDDDCLAHDRGARLVVADLRRSGVSERSSP